MANITEYDFPVFTSPLGGLVKRQRVADEGGGWESVFLTPSTDGQFRPGDKLPCEIDFDELIPANAEARDLSQDARDFRDGLDEFFDLAFKKAEEGKLPFEVIERILDTLEEAING